MTAALNYQHKIGDLVLAGCFREVVYMCTVSSINGSINQ